MIQAQTTQNNLRSKYAMVKLLGEGGFGAVHLAERRSDRKVSA
jgi:serine/threonine protein kinase